MAESTIPVQMVLSTELTTSGFKNIAANGVVDYEVDVSKTGKKAISVIGLYPNYPATLSVRWFRLVPNTQKVELRVQSYYGDVLTASIDVTCLYRNG